MKFRRLKAAAVGLAVFGSVVAVGHAVFALPTGCQLSTTSKSVSAYCSSGDGYYRAAASYRCNGGSLQYKYGSWQRPGGWSESYVNMSSGCYVSSGFLQKKTG